MPWVKGQSGNAGGRSPQLARAREAIAKVVDHSATELADWMLEIRQKEGAREAMKAFVALAEYALPKLARTEITGELDIRKLSDDELDARIAEIAAKAGYRIEREPAQVATVHNETVQ